MNEYCSSDYYSDFDNVINERLNGNASVSSDLGQKIEEKIAQLENENKRNRKRLSLKKKELEETKESQAKHIEMLKESINNLENENKILTEELEKGGQLVDKISKLFYQIAAKGVDFSLYPEINLERIINLVGTPPQLNPQYKSRSSASLDPIAVKIISRDKYFDGIKTNEEFTDRCMQLHDEYKQAKARALEMQLNATKSFASRTSFMSQNRSKLENSNASFVSQAPQLRSVIESSRSSDVNQHRRFACEMRELINEKGRLIDQIVEIKKQMKEREEKYKQAKTQNKTRTVIKLRMRQWSSSKLASSNETTEIKINQ